MSFVNSGYWRDEVAANPRLASSIEFACHDKKGRVGTWTTHEKKIAFALELAKTVPTMTFAQDFITEQESEQSIINDLIEQIRNFRKEIIAPRGDGVAQLFNKVIVTGKGPGHKDDLVMALCIAIFHAFLDRYDYRFQARMRERSLLV